MAADRDGIAITPISHPMKNTPQKAPKKILNQESQKDAGDHDASCDLFVIGAGSAGVRAARLAAASGMKVVVAEDTYIGGTCVNAGCVPKKIFFYAAAAADAFRTAPSFGWTIGASHFDWSALIAAKDKEIRRLGRIYQSLLADVHIERQKAHIEGPHSVRTGKTRWHARHILIATGGRPWKPPIAGIEEAITSDDVFHLPRLPKRLTVLGAGYIGVEFASLFRHLGADVDLVFRSDTPLSGFDRSLRQGLVDNMRDDGIRVHAGCRLDRIEKRDGALSIHDKSGNQWSADVVLAATGRHPRLDIGLDTAGLGDSVDDRGYIRVDRDYRTAVKHIFALGDVIDRPALTPVAIAQATHVVAVLTGRAPPPPIDYDHIATAVFTDPPIASIGQSEEVARAAAQSPIRIYYARFRPLKYALRALACKDEKDAGPKTMMKLIVAGRQETVVGMHMIGDDAPEIIQGFALAMGQPKSRLDAVMAIHPTSAEEFVTMQTAHE